MNVSKPKGTNDKKWNEVTLTSNTENKYQFDVGIIIYYTKFVLLFQRQMQIDTEDNL